MGGFFLFILPVGFVIITGLLSEANSRLRFERAEYKAYVDDADSIYDGFEYKGMKLIQSDYLSVPAKNMDEEGVVVTDSGKEYYISYVNNDNDYDIYNIERLSHGTFCDSRQYDEIWDYYHNPDNLCSKVSQYEDGRFIDIDVDFSPEMVLDIRKLYKNHGNGICYGDFDELGDSYNISAYSEDGLFYESVEVYEFNNNLMIMWTSGGGSFSGILLKDEQESYVRELLY